VPTLYAGARVTATVKAATELESLASSPAVAVTGVGGQAACNDGKDNDGDGKCDFAGCTIGMVVLPADPGCLNANDLDETDVPQCSDGLDNNGTNGIDFPNDPGCSSYLDNSESGVAACSNGVDDDGDGKVDFPADPGCAAADDVNEDDIPACADGIDNDGDGLIDFPADPGCGSALDDDELQGSTATTDLGASGDMSVEIDGGSPGFVRPDGMPPNPGGVEDEGRGCSCDVGGRRGGQTPLSAAVCALIGLMLLRRRLKHQAVRGGRVSSHSDR
jgi:hypothetical protein